MTTPIRVDLTLGAVYGLGLSAVVWLLVLAPPPLDPIAGLVLGLAGVAGASATAFRVRGWHNTTYAVTLAALLAAGPACSCLAGCVCAVAARSSRPRRRSAGALGRIGFRAGQALLAAGVAAGAFVLAGGPPTPDRAWVGLWGAVAVHALAFAATSALVVQLSRLGVRGRARTGDAARRAAREFPGLALGALAGLGAWSALTSPVAAALLATAFGLIVVAAVGRLRARATAEVARHSRELAGVRNAVAQALARTMEERDPSTQDHLRRVHRLSVGVARSLGLSDGELDILGSAALLHDIGKVGVPESILTKPGRLTPEEMEQVKRHCAIGAEIVQALPSARPLAAIIRHHHERWDGEGYPDALAGEEIPLGARILSAVDCYDALTSDRPYRKALTHREATRFLEREAGLIFDSEVVYALLDYLESREPASRRESLPAPELAGEAPCAAAQEGSPIGSVLMAQRELETFYDVSRAMGCGLSLDEFLTLVACRLSPLIPHQSLVVYFLDGERKMLRAGFAMGCAADRLKRTAIPLGQRLSGWAAAHQRAVVGRDHLEPLERDGSRSDLEAWDGDDEIADLQTTLAAPLVAEAGLVGVLTLYDRADRAFSEAERRALVRVAGYVAQFAALEAPGPAAGRTTLTDPLTGVPNARFLSLEAAQRMSPPGERFGLLAFGVGGLERIGEDHGKDGVDRMLCRLARRFATGCRRGETLVRFGAELFFVLSPHHDAVELAERGQELGDEVERPAIDIGEGVMRQVTLATAAAVHPDDGGSLDALLQALDERLVAATRRGRTVIPFRPSQPARGAASKGSA